MRRVSAPDRSAPPARRAAALPALAWVAAMALLGRGIAADAWPWIADDAFISLRYAERLLLGEGLTWTCGERVEGYSNLLWVLAAALLMALGCDPVVAVRALGIAATAAALALLAWSLPRRAPALLAVPLLAAQSAVATWAIGGLEGPLAMALVAAVLAALVRGLRPAEGRAARGPFLAAGIALLLLGATRPDGPLWVAVAAVVTVAFGRRGPHARAAANLLPRLLCLLGPPLAGLVLQTAFRRAYYGEWLPNTAYAKVAPSAQSLAAGLDYLACAAAALRSLLLPAVLGLWFGLRRAGARPAAAFAAAGLLAWAGYLLAVGGDVFPRWRLVLPALAAAAWLSGHGFDGLWSQGRAGRAAAWLAGLLAIGLARADAALEAPEGSRGDLSDWEWQGAAAGRWLGTAFAAQRPLLAVDAAGALPFFSGLPALDMFGLCDRHIARAPVPPGRAFVPGHLRGDGRYVLDRAPDLVVFQTPPGDAQPRWPSGVQMEDDPRFLAGWRCVLFDTGEQVLGDGSRQRLKITAWARLAGRIGARSGARRIEVPGFWLGSYRQPYPFHVHTAPPRPGEEGFERWFEDGSAALQWWRDEGLVGVLDPASGGVVGEVRRPGRHVLRELPVPAGAYGLACEPVVPGVTLALEGRGRAPLPRVEGDFEVRAPADGTALVDVVCTVDPVAPLPLRIARVVLSRR